MGRPEQLSWHIERDIDEIYLNAERYAFHLLWRDRKLLEELKASNKSPDILRRTTIASILQRAIAGRRIQLACVKKADELIDILSTDLRKAYRDAGLPSGKTIAK